MLARKPAVNSRMLATSGEQTTKFAPPRSVFLWIWAETSLTVSAKVSYHSETVPVKSAPIKDSLSKFPPIWVPVSLFKKRPGRRDQYWVPAVEPLIRSSRISRSISRAICSERMLVSSTSASRLWYAARSCPSSGVHLALSFLVWAVTATESTLMSISGILTWFSSPQVSSPTSAPSVPFKEPTKLSLIVWLKPQPAPAMAAVNSCDINTSWFAVVSVDPVDWNATWIDHPAFWTSCGFVDPVVRLVKRRMIVQVSSAEPVVFKVIKSWTFNWLFQSPEPVYWTTATTLPEAISGSYLTKLSSAAWEGWRLYPTDSAPSGIPLATTWIPAADRPSCDDPVGLEKPLFKA